jgi:hypothetical protein
MEFYYQGYPKLARTGAQIQLSAVLFLLRIQGSENDTRYLDE